jgi:dolichol-phosphate mannosyltransferase
MGGEPRVLVVVPVWNEASRVPAVIDDLHRQVPFDVLVVDDGSTDETPQVARGRGCQVISHTANRGVGAAIRTGIRHALDNRYDIVVVVNGTGKTPARCIPDLLRPITDDDYDFIQGSRYLSGGRRDNLPAHRSIGTRIHSAIFGLCVGRTVTDGTSGFRAFRTSLFADRRFQLDQGWLDRYELEVYVYYQSMKLGYRVKEAPVEILYPESGRYTRMRVVVDWWRITRPLFLLKFGLKK